MTAPPPVLAAVTLRAAFEVAERWLAANRDAVNAINVYPVPDGDTGTNMLLTWRAALRAGEGVPDQAAGSYLGALAHGALLGARGNSGVILSQMLAGIAAACQGAGTLDGPHFARALVSAADHAYAAISTPVEGTMLTVMRDAARAGAAIDAGDPAAVLRAAVAEAYASVERTPDLLPRLREAGVVDSGGQGIAVILEGVWHGVTGEPLPQVAAPAPSAVDLGNVAHDGHGYCTEFVLTGTAIDRAEIEAALVAVGGDSILVVGDRETVHVHVHLEDPGPGISIGAARGALASVKVENMQVQHEQWRAGVEASEASVPSIGLVVVARGEGIAAAFRDLGATRILDGGETGKASTGELIEAARAAGRDHAFLLPNDKDVLMAAQRAVAAEPRFITLIPTRSIAAGLGAAFAYLPEGDVAEIATEMLEAAARVRSVEVSRSVRTATVDGVSVREGDAIALMDDRIVAATETLEDALLAGLDAAGAAEAELVTLYLGADAEPDAGEATSALIASRFAGVEVQVIEGGQPHYPYLAGVE
ncbi:MAG: DAK2 domain-containing protein [Chloroflexi bacterium]|nr:MAG: DAK2 domain-containing protein [Chloroflexota bacterium]